MSDGHTFVSSDVEHVFDVISSPNQPNKVNKTVNYLTVSEKGKFKWHGPFEILKSFMKEVIKSGANWSSPGGHCRLLEANDVAVRWYSDSKSLTLNGSSSEIIKAQLRVIATSQAQPGVLASNNNNIVVSDGPSNMVCAETSGSTKQPEVCKCSCTCTGRIAVAEFEGLKLDIAILESRLGLTNDVDHIYSEINSLRNKQRDLEAIIRKQDETISKLYEDNAFFKSKLSSWENLNPTPCGKDNTYMTTHLANSMMHLRISLLFMTSHMGVTFLQLSRQLIL